MVLPACTICGAERGSFPVPCSPSAPPCRRRWKPRWRPGSVPQIGPYHVLGELGRSGDAELMLGYDARLLRKVWLRKVASGTPPLAPALCHLARQGRLRWLNGKRSDEDCWDAYEASAGQPLLNLVSTKQDWEKVRFWLLDLAGELKAGEKDGSRPAVLSLDRVWIAADGRAKLLDFPVPGINSPGAVEPPRPVSPQEFLRQAGLSALEGRPMSAEEARASAVALPLPLYARGFFQRLQTATDSSEIWERLKAVAGKVATITRRRRLAMLAIAVSFPLLTAIMMVMGNVMMRSKDNLELFALQSCLVQIESLRTGWHEFARPASNRGRKTPAIGNLPCWALPSVHHQLRGMGWGHGKSNYHSQTKSRCRADCRGASGDRRRRVCRGGRGCENSVPHDSGSGPRPRYHLRECPGYCL